MNTYIKDLLLLTILIGALFGACLGTYPLEVPDSARYAEIPREMVTSGDYITPHLNGIKYFEKPPLFYWMQAGAIKVFGPNNFAASFVNAFLGLCTCLLVYFVGRKLFNRRTGFLSSLILATSTIIFALTHITTLDMAFTFFLSAALSCFLLSTEETNKNYRDSYLWCMYALAALAVMTKGLIGLIFPLGIIFFYVLIFNEWRKLKTYRIITGLLIFLLITVPWHVLVQIRNPEFLHFYIVEQHFLRYFTTYAGRTQPFWFFPLVLILGFYPWIAFLPQAILNNIPRKLNNLSKYRTTLFLLLWPVVIYIFYSCSNSKLIPYLLPIFPPFAILVGKYLTDNWHTKPARSINISFNFIAIFNILTGIGIGIAAFFIDQQNLAFSNSTLFICASFLLLSGIATMVLYHRQGIASGCIALLITTSLALLSSNPIITVANNQSIMPLMKTLQPKLGPNDEVISFGAYHQDLPFYTKRIITVVNYSGELAFGIKHQDTSKWMLDTKGFWQHWNSNHKAFMIVDKNIYQNLLKVDPSKMFVLAEHQGDVLVTNRNN